MTEEGSRQDRAGQGQPDQRSDVGREFAEIIIDSVPGLFYVFDAQGRFLRWNRNLEQVTGYSAAEIAEMTAIDFFNDEGAEICREAVRIVFEDGESTMENELLTKDGRLITHYFTGARRLINGVPYLVGMAFNITERKQAEKELQNSQATLTEAQEIAHFGSWEWDVKTGEVEWSDEVYRIFGLDPDTFTPQIDSILALSPPEERGRAQELLGRAIKFRETGTYEQHFYRPDGTLGTYVSTFAGRYDEEGELVRMVGVAHDITERKRAENELARTQKLFETVVQQSPIPMAIVTPDGALTFNDACVQYLGVADEPQMKPGIKLMEIKQSWKDYDRDGNLLTMEQLPLARALRGETTRDLEMRVVRKDGTERWEMVNGAPIYDAQGRLIAGFVAFPDITDRKQAEAERENLIRQLENQNAELERFAYTVSHDLKSPLITIKGFLGVVEDAFKAGDQEEIDDGFRRIANAADKMDRLLRDLLELSRIGRIVNEPTHVSLTQLAEDAADIVRGQLDRIGVRLQIDPDLPMAYGDPVRLLEVLQNLLDNAAKYMGNTPDPLIEVGCRLDDNEPVCYVRDNGIGIDPDHLGRVFELFQQLDPNVEGSGIGLALVKRIIEFHGGRVWFESEGPGHGATCCFTVPTLDDSHGRH